jgi:hypothetical protein
MAQKSSDSCFLSFFLRVISLSRKQSQSETESLVTIGPFSIEICDRDCHERFAVSEVFWRIGFFWAGGGI